MTESHADASTFTLASVVLQQRTSGSVHVGMVDGAPAKAILWLIMLLLAIVAVAPGISVLGGLLLLVAAFQMIASSSAPVFPRWSATNVASPQTR